MPEIQRYQNLDAAEGIFFSRELESVKAKTYDRKYPELQARKLFPVSYEADPGAEFIDYDVYTEVGVAELIHSYSQNLPLADVKGERRRVTVYGIGSAFHYSIQDVRAAKMAGKPLQARKASAARRADEEKLDRFAFLGDEKAGAIGFLNHPNIPRVQATVVIASGSDSEDILDMLNDFVNGIVNLTNGTEIPDTLLLPQDEYSYISSKAWSATAGDTTILSYFLANNPYIKEVIPCNRLANAGNGGTDVAICYKRDPDHITLEIPQEFEVLNPQEKGLIFEVPTHMRTGGVIIYYPLSAAVLEGI